MHLVFSVFANTTCGGSHGHPEGTGNPGSSLHFGHSEVNAPHGSSFQVGDQGNPERTVSPVSSGKVTPTNGSSGDGIDGRSKNNEKGSSSNRNERESPKKGESQGHLHEIYAKEIEQGEFQELQHATDAMEIELGEFQEFDHITDPIEIEQIKAAERRKEFAEVSGDNLRKFFSKDISNIREKELLNAYAAVIDNLPSEHELRKELYEQTLDSTNVYVARRSYYEALKTIFEQSKEEAAAVIKSILKAKGLKDRVQTVESLI